MRSTATTIRIAVAALMAVLAIAACGGSSNNGWTSSDTAKLKAKFSTNLSSLEARLPTKDQAKLASANATFLDCTVGVVEPAGTPAQVLSDRWNPPSAAAKQEESKCEKPFLASIEPMGKS